jgi:hypothetical protein
MYNPYHEQYITWQSSQSQEVTEGSSNTLNAKAEAWPRKHTCWKHVILRLSVASFKHHEKLLLGQD